MKYHIQKSRREVETLEIEADSPQAALTQARALVPYNTKWHLHADTFEEVDDDGEIIKEHVLFATCENCDAMVFDEAEYNKGAEGDDGFLCEKCHAAFLASQARDALKHLPTAGL